MVEKQDSPMADSSVSHGASAVRDASPLKLSSAEERESLDAVEARLDGWYPTAPAPSPWRHAWWLSAAACAALFFLWAQPSTAPATHTDNLTRLQGPAGAAGYQVPAHKAGRISVTGHWRLRATQTTRFALAQPLSSPRQGIKLTRGFVKIYVKPGAMKTLVVQSRGYEIAVKGTLFSVEQERSWLRVEVWRGEVLVRPPTAPRVSLRRGQGLRVDLTHHTHQLYRLPPQPNKAPLRLARWHQKHRPKLLHQLGLDLSHSPRFPLPQRGHLLRWLADQEKRAGHPRQAQETLLALHDLRVAGGISENALFEAAQLCRRSQPTTPSTCDDLYQRYLRAYPKGAWREHALYWMATGRYRSQRKIHALRRYLSAYPKGHYRREVQRLLAHHMWHKHHDCKLTRRALHPQDPGPLWLRKRCPSRSP